MIEYKNLTDSYGPLLVVSGVKSAHFDEVVQVVEKDGSTRLGRVIEIDGDRALVQLFSSAQSLELSTSKVRFTSKNFEMSLSPDILGKIMNGKGEMISSPQIVGGIRRSINGSPINPCSRNYPSEFIETGVSSIDTLNTLVRGQKLPIFSMSGLPHSELAIRIASQSRLLGSDDKFAVVFCGIGITFEESQYYIDSLRSTGAMKHSVMFVNLVSDPVIERIITPRLALTCAEYLAFDLGMHVLVIMSDMTSYCEALREVSSYRREVPARRGYPAYMYTDLASIYERAGRIKDKDGSITLIPVLTMPEDDKTHPIPDLTGYITEGQIMLSRDLHQMGIFPPIDPLPSLSRLKDKGIGVGKTREDHASMSSQLFSSYALGKEAKELSAVLGEGALSEEDKLYQDFASLFEKNFLNQGSQRRDIFTSLDMGWDMLSTLPKSYLKRIKDEFIEKYYKDKSK